MGCQQDRNSVVENSQEKIKTKISIGDDIFLAKEMLIDMGFRIQSGPKFATKNKDYYLMIVDYGALPNGFEIFKYTVGIQTEGQLINGMIKAGVDGKITSIE